MREKSILESQNISRRDFLKSLALAGVSISTIAGCAVNSPNPEQKSEKEDTAHRSTVVIVRSKDFQQADRTFIKRMLDTGVSEAFGVESAEIAWKRLFKPNDTVGIKVNTIARMIPTHPQLAYAIADSLIAIEIPPEQIIIWDREDRELESAGYKLNVDAPGIKCYGTKPRVGYGNELMVVGSVGSRLSKIISRQCTATVNAPVLKDHNIAGLSLSLKNYFGAIENPNKFHSTNCDPYVADLNMEPQIREKNKLIICDAINVLFEGGPTDYRPDRIWNYNGLIIGTDPVAVDQIGLMLLEEKRASEGLPPLPAIGRQVKYLATAADPDHRLGIRDPEKIRVVEISDMEEQAFGY